MRVADRETSSGARAQVAVYITKSDLARQHIEEMILSGRARPGDRITSREVSEAIGVSETPIREAIRSLSAEGWLDFHAHLGVVVASIKAEQLIEVYAIRGGLQAVAIRLGGPAYTDKLLADVDRNLEASETAASAGDAALYARLNREFHGFLTNTPTTQWTLKLLTNLWAQTSALHRGFEAAPERIRNSLNEHRAIRAALGARDLERAAQLVVEHERLGGEALIAALRRNGLNEPTDQG